MNTKNLKILLITLAFSAVAAMFFVAPISQDLHYHDFADQREAFGVPNFWNVISNAGFFVVGLIGLFQLLLTHRLNIRYYVASAQTI